MPDHGRRRGAVLIVGRRMWSCPIGYTARLTVDHDPQVEAVRYGGVLFSVIKGGTIMKCIFFGMGTLVLGLATLLWATAPVIGGGHAAGGGHATASVGSVHYGARAAPAQVSPAVHAGSVRSEHYAGSASRGAYRNPYRNDYFRRFPPGYRPFVLNDAQYYGYDSLPIGYQRIVLNGITYYLFESVYYQPYIYEGHTVYLVVPNPQ